MRFEPDDLDWALGELLNLKSLAYRRYTTPFDLDPQLFQECMWVINSQPLDVRLALFEVLNGFKLGSRKASHAIARPKARSSHAVDPSRGTAAASEERPDTGRKDRAPLGVSL